MDARKTSMGKDPNYVTYYTFWSKILFMEAIPYVVIFFLNIIIVSKIFESIRFRKKFQCTKPRDDLSTSQHNLDQYDAKTYNARCDTRRQSSPGMRQTTTFDRSSICYSSSSNLVGNKNVILRVNQPSSRLSASADRKLNTKLVN